MDGNLWEGGGGGQRLMANTILNLFNPSLKVSQQVYSQMVDWDFIVLRPLIGSSPVDKKSQESVNVQPANHVTGQSIPAK